MGPLAGVPVALKDNLSLAGAPLTCGSRILTGYRAPFSATAVERLVAAGAVVVGKTNLDEFAMGSSCEGSAFKPTRNPWHLGTVPGGSSGGSAAAVAAGSVPLALGSDTGGSVRQPAALCGVVGFKPTYGRVSRWGLVAFASSLDQIGPLARNVRDAALALGVIAGADGRDATASPLPVADHLAEIEAGAGGLRVGVVREIEVAELGADSRRVWAAALDRLRAAGAELVEVSIPAVRAAVAVYYVVANCEASANLARFDGVRYGRRAAGAESLGELYVESRSRGFGAEVQRRIMLGTFALSAGYHEAYYGRARGVLEALRGEFDAAFGEVDLVVTPTTPGGAFALGEKLDDPLAMYLSDVFTAPASLAGLPAVAVPAGRRRPRPAAVAADHRPPPRRRHRPPPRPGLRARDGLAGRPAAHLGCRRLAAPRGPARGAAGGGRRMTVRIRALVAAALLALGLAVAATTPSAAAATLRVELGDGLVAAMGDDQRLVLEARPEAREGLLAFARRLCGDDGAAPSIAAENGDVAVLRAGVRYRVPFDLLRPELQRRLVEALFPADAPAADGWRHSSRGAGALGRESLWSLGEWFTGDGASFRAIREYNGLTEEEVAAGQVVTIPAELLRPAFRAALPATSVLQRPALAEPTAADFGLEYGRDDKGEYAAYRLRPGEALYSSVVVRFTGHLAAADVNAVAADIAARNGIRDVTDIPVSYRVKIPFDLLLPEFLPAGDPRRREYEAGLAASSRFTNQVRARGLEGITVLLDPGHGGRDVGASVGGVWESAYVYDVALRVRQLLADHTAAQVVLTTRDGDRWAIPDRDVLPFSRGHEVLTHPPYPIEDSRVGVHLRWYLANSVYRQAMAKSGDSGEDRLRVDPRRLAPPVDPRRHRLHSRRRHDRRQVRQAGGGVRVAPRVPRRSDGEFPLPRPGQERGPVARAGGEDRRRDGRPRPRPPPHQADPREDHPPAQRLGTGGAALQRGAGQGAGGDRQPRQYRGPPADPDPGLPPAGGRVDRPGRSSPTTTPTTPPSRRSRWRRRRGERAAGPAPAGRGRPSGEGFETAGIAGAGLQ